MPDLIQPTPEPPRSWFSPVKGARKFLLRGAELAKAAQLGTVFVFLTGILQLAMAHIDMLHLDPEVMPLVSALLGGIAATIELLRRYYQGPDRPSDGLIVPKDR